MKIESRQTINSSTEEMIEVSIIFDPNNPEEEGLAAMLATVIDLVKKYDRLNHLIE